MELMETSKVERISSLTRNERVLASLRTVAEYVQLPAPPPLDSALRASLVAGPMAAPEAHRLRRRVLEAIQSSGVPSEPERSPAGAEWMASRGACAVLRLPSQVR